MNASAVAASRADELLDLARRVETEWATHSLDKAVAPWFGWSPISGRHVPHCTSDLTTAVRLIPPSWFIAHFSDDGPKGAIYCKLACRTHAADVDSVGAPTRAAAILAASLRAMAAEARRPKEYVSWRERAREVSR